MTLVKRRPNIYTRQSQDAPEVFGDFIHIHDDEGVIRPEKTDKKLPSQLNQMPVPVEEYRNVGIKKEGLQNQRERRMFDKTMPAFDATRFQQYYEQRQMTPEVRMREHGRHPYSFYLINKIKFVNDEEDSENTANQESKQGKLAKSSMRVEQKSFKQQQPPKTSPPRKIKQPQAHRRSIEPPSSESSQNNLYLSKGSKKMKSVTTIKRKEVQPKTQTQTHKQEEENLTKMVYRSVPDLKTADYDFIRKVYKDSEILSTKTKNLYNEHGPVTVGEEMSIINLLSQSKKMKRYDFLKTRRERQENEARQSNHKRFKDITYDIESKDFIQREEIQDEHLMKNHINQPMLEKKAVVARSVPKAETQEIYDVKGVAKKVMQRNESKKLLDESKEKKTDQSSQNSERQLLETLEEESQSASIKIDNQTTVSDKQKASPINTARKLYFKQGGGVTSMPMTKTLHNSIVRELEEINEVSFELGRQDTLNGNQRFNTSYNQSTGQTPKNGAKAKQDKFRTNALGQTSQATNMNEDLLLTEGSATDGSILRSVSQPRLFGSNLRDQEMAESAEGPASTELSQTLWRYRLTDSDFFQRYQDEQKALKEEIARQQAEMKIVKPKAYKPIIKVASQEELKHVHRVQNQTKRHNMVLRKNSEKFNLIKNIKKKGGLLKTRSDSNLHLGAFPLVQKPQQRLFNNVQLQSKASGKETPEQRTSNEQSTNRQTTQNQNTEEVQNEAAIRRIFAGGDTGQQNRQLSYFDEEIPIEREAPYQSRTSTQQIKQQLGTSKSLIQESDLNEVALVKRGDTPAKRPITREPSQLKQPLMMPQKVTSEQHLRSSSHQDTSTVNIKLATGSEHSLVMTQKSMVGGSITPKRFFKDMKKQVSNIAKNYVQQQRQLIEERTSKNSARRSQFGSDSARARSMESVLMRTNALRSNTDENEDDKSKDNSSIQTSESLKEFPDPIIDEKSQNSFRIPHFAEDRRLSSQSGFQTNQTSPKQMIFGGRRFSHSPETKNLGKSHYKSEAKHKDSLMNVHAFLADVHTNSTAQEGLGKGTTDTNGRLQASTSQEVLPNIGSISSETPIIKFTSHITDMLNSNTRLKGAADLQTERNVRLALGALDSKDTKTTKKQKPNKAEKELRARENFKLDNAKLVKQMMDRNPQVVVPSLNMQILDQMPRIDINEEQIYRRAIPKSIKMYKFRRHFSEYLDKLPTSTKFCNAITKAALETTKEREEKYHREELQEANRAIDDSMRETLSLTKFSTFFKTKGAIENQALSQVKQSTRKLFRKPVVSDALESRSTQVTKSSINKQTKARLFGGLQLEYPESSPMLALLQALDEDQLYKLNVKVCQLYQKNLTAKRNQTDLRTIIDDDPRIRKRRPIAKLDAAPAFQGPPLQRKAGHFKFKDRFETPLVKKKVPLTEETGPLKRAQWASAANLLSVPRFNTNKNATLNGASARQTKEKEQDGGGLDTPLRTNENFAQASQPYAALTSARALKPENYDTISLQATSPTDPINQETHQQNPRLGHSSLPSVEFVTPQFASQSPSKDKKIGDMTRLFNQLGGGYGPAAQPVQGGCTTRRRVNKSLEQIREMNARFEHLEEYQELVNQALQEAIGKEMFKYRSFYAASQCAVEDATSNRKQSRSMLEPGMGNSKAPDLNKNAKDMGQTNTSSLFNAKREDSAQGLTSTTFFPDGQNRGGTTRRGTTKMIRRKEAMETLHETIKANDHSLPNSLTENKIRADVLLFKEAQAGYLQRRKEIQKQIVIDNIQFCTLKQITDQADDEPEIVERKQRNAEVKEKARKVMIREEKRLYGDKYQSILEQRRQKLDQQVKAKEDEVRQVLLGITSKTDKESAIELKKTLKQVRKRTQYS